MNKNWARFQMIGFFFFFFAKFRTFLYFSKCKALGDFLISFLEMDVSKSVLGDISQNSSFRN